MNDWEQKGNRFTELKRIQQFTQFLQSQIYHEPIRFTLQYHRTHQRLSLDQTRSLQRQLVNLGEVWGSEWESGYFYLSASIPSDWLKKELVVHIDLGGEALIYEPYSGRGIWSLTQGSVFSEGYHKEYFFLTPEMQPWFIQGRSTGTRKYSEQSTGDNQIIGLYLEAAANGLFGMDAMSEPIRRDDPNRHGTWEARVKVAQVGVFDRPTWNLFLDMDYLIRLYKSLDHNTVRAQRILKACLTVAYSHTRLGSTEVRSILVPELSKPAEASALRTSVIGHAHIDTAWLWPLAETRRKVVRTFSSQLDLFNRYPSYKFGASAPHHYRWFQEDQPELFKELESRVSQGRWELQGGMWVEPDCNLISGESLIRQILHGQRYWKETFGKTVKTCWIPDVFGYSAAMPQILRLGGLEFFLTQKMSWSKINPFPHDTFYWKGIDGTKVLTHFPPEYTYNSYGNPEDLRKAVDTFQEKADLDEFMTLVGIGNGGGGPKEEHIEHILRSENTESVPQAQFDFSEVFFQRLKGMVSNQPNLLAEWKGELYLEYHRGTYTTQAMGKRNNRLLEEYFAVAESLWTWVLAEQSLSQSRSDAIYPRNRMDEMVKTMLLLQFHDILPGSSIHQVYIDSLGMYLKQFSLLGDSIKESIDQLFPQEEGSLVLVNSSEGMCSMVDLSGVQGLLEFGGTDMVLGADPFHGKLENLVREKLKNLIGIQSAGYNLTDTISQPYGTPGLYLVHQIPRLEGPDRLLTQVDLPNQGAIQLRFGLPRSASHTSDSSLSSPSGDKSVIPTLHVCSYAWEPLGENQDSIYHLTNSVITYCFSSNGSFGIPGTSWAVEPGNLFELYEDTPHSFEAWDIDHYYPDQLQSQATNVKTYRLEPTQKDHRIGLATSDQIQGLRFELSIGESMIYQDVFLYPNDLGLEFDTKIDWKETRKLLRVSFPVDPDISESNSDISCGFISRPTGTNTSWDQAKFEFPARTYVDVSGIDGGCALISDSKYGFSCRQGRLGMSLLRAPLYPDPDADLGIHQVRYVFMPHQADLIHSQVQTRATLFNRPPLVLWNRGLGNKNSTSDHQQSHHTPRAVCLPIQVIGSGIRLMALKPAEDGNGFIVRFCENHGRNQRAEIFLPSDSWVLQPVDGLEQPMTEELARSLGRNYTIEYGMIDQSKTNQYSERCSVNITLKPFEIQTYRVVVHT
jgi:alpha-mannosidase